jgi:GAF domain-containing protein/histidine kinase/DNA gyrase B/HSP90-like ATPase
VSSSVDDVVGTSAANDVPGGVPAEVAAMLAVSRNVAEGRSLRQVLNHTAREAAGVVGAETASVLLLHGSDRFRLAGSHGLSRGYGRLLASADPLMPGRGPSGLAVKTGQPVIFTDVETDPRFVPWREVARQEGFRSTVAVPLQFRRAALGALNVYRRDPGAWDPHHVELLLFFARHAASAIRAAQLLDAQARQLQGLQRLVQSLREQTHEHANRLHAIQGLLALGDVAGVEAFVAGLGEAYHESADAIAERIAVPVVAGLVLAEITNARQSGTRIVLDPSSRLTSLPPTLTESDAVTVIGNLLQNAREAVATEPRDRRRVALTLAQTPVELRIEVRSSAPIPDEVRRRAFRRGYSSKAGHPGVGLNIVSDVVAATMGTVEVTTAGGNHAGAAPGEVVFTVRVPYA